MHKIMVAGIGTEVGKTVTSALLTLLFEADYWKPVECGGKGSSDTATMKKWTKKSRVTIYPPAYSFKTPLSPHQAASLEKRLINLETIKLPQTKKTLIIEGVGGVLVPLTNKFTTLDLFKSWDCLWVIVSKHYLGSINHTLLTIGALKEHKIPIIGLIFNGEPNLASESVILDMSQLPFLGRLLPEKNLNKETFQRYIKQWRPSFLKHL